MSHHELSEDSIVRTANGTIDYAYYQKRARQQRSCVLGKWITRQKLECESRPREKRETRWAGRPVT